MKPISKNKQNNNKTLKLSLSLIITAFGFLLYCQTIGFSFVLDDASAIKQNHLVQEGIRGIGTLIHTQYRYGYWTMKDELFRPLSLILFATEWQFFPDSSTMFHFINVLLYCLTGFLIFRLLSRFFKNDLIIPFIASLLFLAHPVHTEVAASIKSGDEILCFIFCILTIDFVFDFLQTNKKSKLITLAITFFMALLAKETAITMLLIIPLILFFFRELKAKSLLIIMSSLSIPLFVYLALRFEALGGIINTKEIAAVDNILAIAPSYISRASTAIFVLGKYLLLLILPFNLSTDYSASEITIIQPSDYRFLISFVILLFLFLYAFICFKKKDVIAFCILFFLITISIVSNLFVLIGTVMADRLLYIPSLGFCLLLAILLNKILGNKNPSKTQINLFGFIKNNSKLFWATGIILIIYSTKTISRNSIWKDNNSIYIAAVKDAPKSSRNHYLYALYLLDNEAIPEQNPQRRNELFDEVVNEFQASLDFYPTNFKEYLNHSIKIKSQDHQLLVGTYRMMATTFKYKGDTANTIKYSDLANKIESNP